MLLKSPRPLPDDASAGRYGTCRRRRRRRRRRAAAAAADKAVKAAKAMGVTPSAGGCPACAGHRPHNCGRAASSARRLGRARGNKAGAEEAGAGEDDCDRARGLLLRPGPQRQDRRPDGSGDDPGRRERGRRLLAPAAATPEEAAAHSRSGGGGGAEGGGAAGPGAKEAKAPKLKAKGAKGAKEEEGRGAAGAGEGGAAGAAGAEAEVRGAEERGGGGGRGAARADPAPISCGCARL